MTFLQILVQIIASSFGLVCILALTKWKYSKVQTFVLSGLFIALMSAINYIAVRDLSYLLEYIPAMDFVYRISNIIIYIIFILFIIEKKAPRAFFSILTVIVCVLVVDTLAISLRVWLRMYAFELALELLLYSAMTFFMIKLRKPFIQITGELDKRLWPLSVIPIMLTLCFFMQISFPAPLERMPSNIPVALSLCGMTASVYGIVYFLFKTLLTQGELERNMRIMRLNLTSLEQQNKIALQNAKSTALFRHDLRHIGHMILACLDSGDTLQARELLRDMDKNIRAMDNLGTVREITGHKLLDAALSYYALYSKELGIDISMTLCRMDNVRADKSELAVVLSNALENAVNACSKIRKGEGRYIRVDGRDHGGQYFLEIANTHCGTVSFDPITGLPISGTEGRGLGSQSISYFVNKHGASLEYGVNNNWFHLRLLL